MNLDLDRISAIANKAEKDAGYTRRFYSYPAKFQHRLPRYLIETLTAPGELVVDPYVGGGTTGLESLLSDRAFVGYDLNALAVLVSRVKTTRLSPNTLKNLLAQVLRGRSRRSPLNYLDQRDVECVGGDNARRMTQIADAIWEIDDRRHRDFFLVALVHALKIIGRRDYDEGTPEEDSLQDTTEMALFQFNAPEQIESLFDRKATRMIEELQSLPPRHRPVSILHRSNHDMHEVPASQAAVIVTSPPYKDLDVEYALLQFQRPSLNRSKRSSVLEHLLHVESAPSKNLLCGQKGDSYWQNIRPTFRECARILRRGSYAFFWTGFKTQQDHDDFIRELDRSGFSLIENMPVTLGNDRVASSRSTHHERDTGMLSKDYLIITRRRDDS